MENYKGHKFVNIEQMKGEEVRKVLGIDGSTEESSEGSTKLPEEDVTNFCLWLKDCLSHKVKTVSLSSRLTSVPAILQGQMSSSMYMMM